MDQRITVLENDSTVKDKRISELEGAVTNLHTQLQTAAKNFEQQLHSNEVIISGLTTHHKRFSSAASTNPAEKKTTPPLETNERD